MVLNPLAATGSLLTVCGQSSKHGNRLSQTTKTKEVILGSSSVVSLSVPSIRLIISRKTVSMVARWSWSARHEGGGKGHRVENFFCKIKSFRPIATRYDQTESSHAAMVRMAAVWLALA